MTAAVERGSRIDILHNNVGVSVAGGDTPLDELTEAVFDHVTATNLRGTIMACKHVLPVMRRLRSGRSTTSRRWRLTKTPIRWSPTRRRRRR
jgi:NAD(P)-dependent dehydrogenase (short-subunit alcohol dehydrogenase family)